LLLAALEQLEASGTTLVFTTHDLDVAWAFADDAALFKDGRVFAQGAVGEALVDEERMAEAGLTLPLLARLGLTAKASGALSPTHFLTKTLGKVKTEMSLHVLAYNMKRMINIFGVRPLMKAIAG